MHQQCNRFPPDAKAIYSRKKIRMDRFTLARGLVCQAGATLRKTRIENDAVMQKTDHQDLVTRFDRETEQFLRKNILSRFPEDTLVGEEYPADVHGPGRVVWYIDPVDGTTNFINEHRNYAVSVGCWQAGAPLFGLVLDVERQALYAAQAGQGAFCGNTPLHVSSRAAVAELLLTTPGIQYTFLLDHPRRAGLRRLAADVRGVRSLGSVALELCAVAVGEADAFIAMRSSPWDHNAARIILAEAGGSLCTLSGEPLPQSHTGPVLAANSPALLQTLVKTYCGAE